MPQRHRELRVFDSKENCYEVKPTAKKTKRPKPAAPDWLLDNIAEAFKKRPQEFTWLYIGFLAYCALTVVSTTDRQIVLNEPAKLPIINVEVALNGFFLPSDLLNLRALNSGRLIFITPIQGLFSFRAPKI